MRIRDTRQLFCSGYPYSSVYYALFYTRRPLPAVKKPVAAPIPTPKSCAHMTVKLRNGITNGPV